MKKLNKIFSIVMIAMMLVCVSTNVFASGEKVTGVDIDKLKDNSNLQQGAVDGMSKIGGTIIDLITNAAMILAVVIIAVLGVKYMMGSAEEKAEYKRSMVPYLVGAVLVFGATTIAKIVVNIM